MVIEQRLGPPAAVTELERLCRQRASEEDGWLVAALADNRVDASMQHAQDAVKWLALADRCREVITPSIEPIMVFDDDDAVDAFPELPPLPSRVRQIASQPLLLVRRFG